MDGFDQTLLIRALNSTRQLYFPSYVGLRLIGSQLSSSENDYLRKLVRRRLIAGDAWRFKPFQLYKGSIPTPQGLEHQYRNCLAPSPLTAIAEAFILMRFAKTPAFKVSPRVYSYGWPPSNKSGGSYRYFFDGYKQRNTDIAAALKASNHIAVVTDLKQFYPSVNNETVKSVLKSRLSQAEIKSKVLFEGIFGFYSQLLESGGGGIPIGPASAHVLGHIVLQDVDSELTSRYGNKYFRYVDDIVVVCHQRDEDAVKQDIQNCIENHGFAINTDKTTLITGADWQNHILRADGSDEDNLWQMCSDLAKNLAFHPDRADVIKKMFADEGFCIPVERLLALSRYGPFRYFITRWKLPSVIIHASKLYSMTNDDFLQRGKRLKSVYESSLLELANAPEEKSSSFRRWQVQRARRVINTLFYLRRFEAF